MIYIEKYFRLYRDSHVAVLVFYRTPAACLYALCRRRYGDLPARSLRQQLFMNYYQTNATTTMIEITPVCEEVMKLLPLLFYFLIFEPEKKQVTSAALALSVGFATFENACYLTENGASQFSFLLIRGISAGAVHILCGILIGCGMAYVFYHRWLRLTGTIGLVGACIILHASYNLLITADGIWRRIGYVFPSLLILLCSLQGIC